MRNPPPPKSVLHNHYSPLFINLIQTALHFCASKNNLDVARKLIARKASARVKDRRGQLPLHRAAAVGSVPMVNLLLDNQSPLNATDVANYTALHHGMYDDHSLFLRFSLLLLFHSRQRINPPPQVASHFRRRR